MKDLVWIGGPTGIGKSSLSRALSSMIGGKIVRVERLILEIAKEEYSDITIPELKTKEWKKWEEGWINKLIGILSHTSRERLLVETHYAVPHQGEYREGFSRQGLKRIQEACKVRQAALLIVLPAEELLRRRLEDKSKPNRAKEIDLAQEEIYFNREFFQEFANYLAGLSTSNITLQVENIHFQRMCAKVVRALSS